MENLFYRFRSVEKLLDETYQELEPQRVYFEACLGL